MIRLSTFLLLALGLWLAPAQAAVAGGGVVARAAPVGAQLPLTGPRTAGRGAGRAPRGDGLG
ncbi:MAG: hypothetical protein K0M70_15370, partial [Arenimonas sp.]|uniref:hypothetical protein n=1 Tax=Arenimonas sp. TaxID=1872635 RepID=UPI0025C44C41